MAFRASDIVGIINAVTYPIPITFHTQEILPSHRIYPLVEIVNVQPEGTREKVDVIEESNTFEIRIILKYNRTLDIETQDLADIEKTMLSLLENAVLADKTITLEDKKWQRGSIRDNPNEIHGIQSILTVLVTEVKSTSGDGILGAEEQLILPGITIDLLSSGPNPLGINFSEDFTESGKRALTKTTDKGSLFFEYENTFARNTAITSLVLTGAIIPITHKKKGNDFVYNVLLVTPRETVPFDNIERVILQAEVQTI